MESERKYVLLAEDEEVVTKINCDMLENLGYSVISVTNGQEAVAKFKECSESIAFAILDIVMPKLNGEQTFYALREIDPELMVIFSSGFSRNTSVDLLLRYEGTSFIHKPFRQVDLEEKIEELLKSNPTSALKKNKKTQ